jgi:hypothetical protein
MPSVKSYQNRKADVVRLTNKIIRMQNEFQEVLAIRNAEIFRLGKANQHYVNAMVDYYYYTSLAPAPILIQPTGFKEIELLKKEIDALKITLRLYREYILKAYDPDAADLIEIPQCLKPLDAIRYAGEKQC